MMSARGICGKWSASLLLALVFALVCGTPIAVQAAPTNTAPVISGRPSTIATPGKTYVFKPTAYDANRDRLTFAATGVPGWARFDRWTGQLSGTPTQSDIGRSSTVRISVSDGRLTAAMPSFRITVVNATTSNAPPTIGGTPPASVVEGELYGFLPTASDPDRNPLLFSIQNKPEWATFTASSGLLSGIPPVGSAGVYQNIRISVSDGTSSAALPPFSITVQPKPNSPPSIWGIPASTVDAGSLYSFRPSASDPDGQSLQFSVQGMPSWASFDTATGELSGTPLPSHAGTYPGIVISVSDGTQSSSLSPFSVTVVATNRPPTIGGTPPDSVRSGQPYDFVPSASDPDGQALTFSIRNQPAWATFDAATGRLAGTPDAADAGSYAGIEISVSDGALSSALPTFAVTVIAEPTRAATVSWTPPTQHEDGSPLTNLAGFRVVYGQSADALSNSIDIPSAVVTSATIEDLSPGTWYFAVKAYTTANLESNLSQIGQKTVN